MAHLHNLSGFGKEGDWKNKLPLLWRLPCGLALAVATTRSDEKHCQSGNRSPVNVSVWSDFYSGTSVTGCLWKRFHMLGNPRGTVTQLSFDIRFMKKLLLWTGSFKRTGSCTWVIGGLNQTDSANRSKSVIFWLCSILCYCGFY